MKRSFHGQKDKQLQGDLDDAGKGVFEDGPEQQSRRTERNNKRDFDGKI